MSSFSCFIENKGVIWLLCCWYIEFKEVFMYVLECFGDNVGLGLGDVG